MESIKVTLYDIFGYLVPGLFLLAAIAVTFWAVLIPTSPLRVTELPTQLVIVILTGGYICGHALQGAINVIEHLLSVLIRIPEFPSPPGELVEASRNKMLNSAGIHLPSGWSRQLLDLCDEFVLQQGKGERIDLFEYRRGFYRGMSLALLLLSASLLVKCSLGHTVLTIPATANASTDTVLVPLTTAPPAPTSPPAATNVEITAGMLAYSAVCFLLLSMLLCVRYLRFARHRVRVAVAGFLALKDEKPVASSASDT